MKKYQNKVLFFLIFFLITPFLFSSTVEIGSYKLEIVENSGRFRFYLKNEKKEDIPLLFDSDPRTSSFSIFENGGLYTLGDTFHFRKKFEKTSDGGIFLWSSKDLLVRQVFTLNDDGVLKIDISISNISTGPKSVGLKFLLDTVFEQEDYFYLNTGNRSVEIDSEYELETPEELNFWTAGARNTKGAALMMISTETKPSRIIFANWDFLNDADYYYRTVTGRAFNNPPYSINDSGALYLFSPKNILPQNNLEFSFKLKAINSVEDLSEVVLEEKNEPVIIENSEIAESSIEVPLPESADEEMKDPELTVTDSDKMAEDETEPEPDVSALQDEIEDSAQVEDEIIVNDTPVSSDQKPDEIEEMVSLETEKEEEEEPFQIDPESDELIIQKLLVTEEINNLIETLTNKGIIDENDITNLEELINQLEELSTDENKQ